MEERILVAIYVPIVHMSFDLYLPKEASVTNCLDICYAYLKQQQIFLQQDLLLYHENENKVLSRELTIQASGIYSGDKIILL